jgi:redox-sensitive bicupin YhaK (pirin superfamily)
MQPSGAQSIQENTMKILERDTLTLGGFAGLKEHQLVKDPKVFGSGANQDGSWPGLGGLVYIADARFMPHGETQMHPHHEIDVISVMVEGRIEHHGSMAQGQNLDAGDVQIQRAGGEGFLHNEVNPDDQWNRMIQLWILPETAGEPAAYEVFQSEKGKVTRVYGGEEHRFVSKTCMDVAMVEAGQEIQLDGPLLAYLTRGVATANGQTIKEGDLVRSSHLALTAEDDLQLIIISTEQ